jgi:dTDP-4-dehydrorhamnose reductase
MVTGAGGQLGRCLVEALHGHPRHVLLAAHRHAELDITERDAVRRAILDAPGGPPSVLVNAAAMTDVDRCESEIDAAWRVNALAPALLAEVCQEVGAIFVHVSTDYVFGGDASRPYREDDPTQPHSVYGRSKREGEQRAQDACARTLVVRTAWLFGPGRNFVRTILAAAARAAAGAGPALRVVDDQRGSPTWAGHLAQGLIALVEAEALGTYHLANSGSATWWDLARAAVDAWGHPELPIERVKTAAFPRPAPRPSWSVLDLRKARSMGVSLPSWQDGLHAYLQSGDSPITLAGTIDPNSSRRRPTGDPT